MVLSQTGPLCFEWQSAPNGTWERDIDEAEIFYKRLAKGSRCHPVTAAASFVRRAPEAVKPDNVTNQVEAALRKAWIALRWKHPTLGSHIEHDPDTGRWKRVYAPSTGGHEVNNWARLTFKVADAGISADEWFNEDSAVPELATLLLIRPNDETGAQGTIFLQCPHDITDGIGVLHLINQLFELAALVYEQEADYASADSGGEIARLSPCLRIAADIPSSLPNAQLSRFDEIKAQNTSLYDHPHLLSLPPSSAVSQGKTQRRVISMSSEIAEEILSRCRLVGPGVSVTHIFTAALTVVLSELQSRKDERYPVRYVNHSMINLRPFCRIPYDGRDHAAAAYHTISAQALGIDMFVPRSNERHEENMVPSIATAVRDFYKSVRPTSSSTGPHEQVLFAPSVFQAHTPPPGVEPHAMPNPPFCPVALSSLGKIELIVAKTHGPFSLTGISAFSEPIGAGVALFLGSWDGKMELSGVFNSQYHDPAYIEEFLQRIMSSVYSGLDIADRKVEPMER